MKRRGVTLIGLLIVFALIAWLAFIVFRQPVVAPESALDATQIEPKFLSLSIEPSHPDGGWIIYRAGAKIQVIGQNLKRVEIRYYPTGTGVGELYTGGIVLGEAKKSEIDPHRWEFAIPEGLMATNLWAIGTGLNGEYLQSQDLGPVGFEN